MQCLFEVGNVLTLVWFNPGNENPAVLVAYCRDFCCAFLCFDSHDDRSFF